MIGIAALALSSFTHVVVIIQENRTPDNLFYALCATQPCSTTDPAQYDIQTTNWLDSRATGGMVQPHSVPLATAYDLRHTHQAWVNDYASGAMNGFWHGGCFSGSCPKHYAYGYVDNSTGIIQPYLDLATQFGWSNLMFQTNQGPSMSAHQYLFGATSAPTTADDAAGTFAAENPPGFGFGNNGCTANANVTVATIDASGVENGSVYPCFEHATLSDLLEGASWTWRYYAANASSIWLAPLNIGHICQSTGYGGQCVGPDWTPNIDLTPADVLTDIQNCNLRNVSWVTPTAANSDHAGKTNRTGGPSWVASIVNTIGQSKCVDPNGLTYWPNTAIIVTWDDWGGWYDHEPPQILAYPQGGYQLGFRVPLIFVSAYTPQGYIDNNRLDFGSIIRFVEGNFGLPEGALGFADARAASDLSSFYNLQMPARAFVPILARHNARYFITHRSDKGAPDND